MGHRQDETRAPTRTQVSCSVRHKPRTSETDGMRHGGSTHRRLRLLWWRRQLCDCVLVVREVDRIACATVDTMAAAQRW
jgi:hypothetical protein